MIRTGRAMRQPSLAFVPNASDIQYMWAYGAGQPDYEAEMPGAV